MSTAWRRSTSTSSARSPTGRRHRRPRPRRRYAAADLFEAGGLGLVTRELLKKGLIDGSTPNVDGGTIASNAGGHGRNGRPEGRPAIETPLSATGGLTILHGTLAPDGCVIKLAGHERRFHKGPARVFETENACYDAVRGQKITRAT